MPDMNTKRLPAEPTAGDAPDEKRIDGQKSPHKGPGDAPSIHQALADTRVLNDLLARRVVALEEERDCWRTQAIEMGRAFDEEARRFIDMELEAGRLREALRRYASEDYCQAINDAYKNPGAKCDGSCDHCRALAALGSNEPT
jgi:hypothetical protein